ncbi:MAG: hypothetical protein WDZ27_04665 [Waddliaceae bacterium]
MNINCSAPQHAVWSFLRNDLRTVSPAVLTLISITGVAHTVFRKAWFFQLISKQEHWGALLGGFVIQELTAGSLIGNIGKIASIIVEISLNLIETYIQIIKIRRATHRLSLAWNGHLFPVDGGLMPSYEGTLQYKTAVLVNKISQTALAAWQLLIECFMLSVVIWKTVDIFKNPRDAFTRSIFNIRHRAPELLNHPAYREVMDESYTLFSEVTKDLPKIFNLDPDSVVKYVEKNYTQERERTPPIPSFIGRQHRRMKEGELMVRQIGAGFLQVHGFGVPGLILSPKDRSDRDLKAYQPFPAPLTISKANSYYRQVMRAASRFDY